jgi:hypothetical protein
VLQERKSQVRLPDEVTEFFLIYIIPPVALGSGVYSASNRDDYHKHKENVSGKQIVAGT